MKTLLSKTLLSKTNNKKDISILKIGEIRKILKETKSTLKDCKYFLEIPLTEAESGYYSDTLNDCYKDIKTINEFLIKREENRNDLNILMKEYKLNNEKSFGVVNIDDNNFYFLNDDGKYYVDEGAATLRLENAKKFNSIEDIVKSVPIMKDWNWDYKVYLQIEGNIILVPEKKWVKINTQFKEANKIEYDILYNSGKSGFLRITKP
jgi:hypothetical protein